jgi:hypothetical protein
MGLDMGAPAAVIWRYIRFICNEVNTKLHVGHRHSVQNTSFTASIAT